MADTAIFDVEREHGDALRDAWTEEFDRLIGEVQPFEATASLLQEVYDCTAAGKLGIPTIAVRTGDFSHEELVEAGAA